MKSDMELRSDVEVALEWNPEVRDASDIAVSAKSGVIALTGQVSSFSQKWRAETVAKRV